MTGEALFETARVRARALQADDRAMTQTLLEQCSDYFRLASGLPPGPAEAQSLVSELPPDKSYDDKLLLGLFDRSDQLVGVLDAIRDYPDPGVWHIGLLLIAPEQRGQGMGTELYRAFEKWAAPLGAQAIRLGVLAQNEAAHRFWERLGFMEIARRPQKIGALDKVVIILRRSV